MQQPAPSITILVLATQDDIIAGLTRLLTSAGITVVEPARLEEIVASVQDGSALVFPAEEDDSSVVDELLGTARRFQQTVKCCIVLSKQFMTIRDDLRKQFFQYSRRRPKNRTLTEVERDYIVKTLDETKWQYKTTAKILGIDRSTLYRKLKKFGLLNGENSSG